MNVPNYTPIPNPPTLPYSNPNNQYPINNACPPPNVYSPPPVIPPYSGIQQQPIQTVPQGILLPPSNTPLLINQGNNYSLEAIECLESLNSAYEARIAKESQGLLMKDTIYLVSLKGGDNRIIFIAKKEFAFFSDESTWNIKVKYVPRDVIYENFAANKDFSKRLFDISSNHFLGGGLGVQIGNEQNGYNFGNIRQPICCCCSDPDYQLINNRSMLKYRITTDGCQCAYCCCDGCCCAEYETHFRILDSTKTQLVGEITKNELNFNHKLTYNVTLPRDSLPEEKLQIISAVMAIDSRNYRTIGL